MRIPLFFIIALVVATACTSGRIPCPTVKTAKLKRSYVNRGFIASSTRPAKAEEKSADDLHQKASRQDVKYNGRVTVEDWDCPKPGAKKYMPKSIKENIRRNMKRMYNDQDSVSGGRLQSPR